MVDVVDAETRSRMMSGIRGKDTKPELTVRRYLHSRGLRYRLNVKDLPGKPDLVFPKYGVAVFVHGCFWHWHECRYFRLPATRTQFWQEKLEGNKRRDANNMNALQELGWQVIVVYECSLRDDAEQTLEKLYEQIRAKHPLSQKQ